MYLSFLYLLLTQRALTCPPRFGRIYDSSPCGLFLQAGNYLHGFTLTIAARDAQRDMTKFRTLGEAPARDTPARAARDTQRNKRTARNTTKRSHRCLWRRLARDTPSQPRGTRNIKVSPKRTTALEGHAGDPRILEWAGQARDTPAPAARDTQHTYEGHAGDPPNESAVHETQYIRWTPCLTDAAPLGDGW